jgi:hypothetical protein
VLGASIAVLGTIMALGGLAQKLRPARRHAAVRRRGSSANGPGSYSLLVDSFRPFRIPLVFALLQLGFIGGTSIGAMVGGQMIGWTGTLPEKSRSSACRSSTGSGAADDRRAGLVAGCFTCSSRSRRGAAARRLAPDRAGRALRAQVRGVHGMGCAQGDLARKAVFLPLFAALAMSAVESQGLIPVARAVRRPHLRLGRSADRRLLGR